jgi:hypothetical protein
MPAAVSFHNVQARIVADLALAAVLDLTVESLKAM